MSEPIPVGADTDERNMARLYRMQVREVEHFAMFLMAPDGTISTWNRAIENIFGYTEQEWLGQNGEIVFRDDDRAAGVPEQEMRTAAEQGWSTNVRWHQRRDKSPVYMTGVLRSLRDEDGSLIGFSKIFLDDTPRKLIEDSLTRSNTDLQQFAFVASHDLQEPLRTIATFSDILKQQYSGKLDPKADRMLEFIVQSAGRMSQLIADLLTYSQMASAESHATSVKLDEDFETALSLIRSSMEASGAIITHDPLPQIRLDRNQSVRLFVNLLGNAIKFRQRDRIPKIHVSVEHQSDQWLFKVRDNGIGFPPEKATSLFEPFQRLHAAQDYPGSGIGLAACKRIVESYGGRIGADSVPGEGSTFWFTLPQETEA